MSVSKTAITAGDGTGGQVATRGFTDTDSNAKVLQRIEIDGSDGVESFGTTSDTAASTDTGTFTLIALFKRLLQYFGATTAPTFTNLVKGMTAQMTATTSTQLLGAPGSAVFNYISAVTVSNAHATVGTEVTLQDGSAGTAFWTFPAAPAYGGATIAFDPPLKQPTANTALYCVNLITGSATKVSVSGYTAA